MAYRENEPITIDLLMKATIIPHSVDGKHWVEIVLIDERWQDRVPRPSLTVTLEKPFDPITGEAEQKIREVFGKSVLNFAALGVVASMVQQNARLEAEKAPLELDKPDGPPLLPDLLAALRKAGVALPDPKKKS